MAALKLYVKEWTTVVEGILDNFRRMRTIF